MATKKVPVQETFRDSKDGRFITEREAKQNPRESEREMIKHPERKK